MQTSVPCWTSSSSFDSFLSGLDPELVSSSFLEDLVDQFRSLTERCDRVETVMVRHPEANQYKKQLKMKFFQYVFGDISDS